jgi:hypothetical protein
MNEVNIGSKVRKINGSMLLGSIGEVAGLWTSPYDIKFAWVKYPEWSVPILEFVHWLEPVETRAVVSVQNTPTQLALF